MKSYYFIGILGTGMSALARVTREIGYIIGGSDRNLTGAVFNEFKSLGISLHTQNGNGIEQFVKENNVELKDVVIVKSTAIEDTVSDLIKARELGLTEMHRSDLLAEFFNGAQCPIAIAGTAGKTSVSSMTAFILDSLGMSPSFVIGATARNFSSSSRHKNSKHFVIEADESDGTIIKYRAGIGVLTNISKEHKELNELHELFDTFINNITTGGTALINISCPEAARLYNKHLTEKDRPENPKLKTIEFEYNKNAKQSQADYRVTDIMLRPDGSSFKINQVSFTSGLIGSHNVENFAIASAAAHISGADLNLMPGIIQNYSGVARRLEVIGRHDNIVIIDDYAHNPHEIKTVIDAVKLFKQPVIAVYQPHGYGPTALTRTELSEAFRGLKNNDRLFINEIYYGGGTVNKTITSRQLVDEIKEKLEDRSIIDYCASIEDTARSVTDTIKKSKNTPWIVLVMGARDINKICPQILNNISSHGA